MSQVLEEFCNIFGPELKAVTGDPRRIEDVLRRVEALVKPVSEVNRYSHLSVVSLVWLGGVWYGECGVV